VLEMPTEQVIVVGAGIGGLVAAVLLSARGAAVTLVERSAGPGGKMRHADVAGRRIDVGPTVLTMRHVFEEIFDAAGASLSDYVTLRPTEILARHAWSANERLDLFTDIERSADAIGAFAGAAEANGYRAFCDRAQRIYDSLDLTFIRAQRPSLNTLVASFGLRRLGDLWQISPFISLWKTLGEHFRDPRLRQLFGRYATYCGSSPFMAPATLMLVAHVEREGVWLVDGGMYRLAQALATLATRAGATLRYRSEARELSSTEDASPASRSPTASVSTPRRCWSTPIRRRSAAASSAMPSPIWCRPRHARRDRSPRSPGRW
jgi:1-hydroxycarotenoid 3,4-desaturase